MLDIKIGDDVEPGTILDLSLAPLYKLIFTNPAGAADSENCKLGSKNLVTYSSDLAYNGMVGMGDIVYYNLGVRAGQGSLPNVNQIVSNIGETLHGKDLDLSNNDLSQQTLPDGNIFTWNSSQFINQSVLESNTDYVSPLVPGS